MAGTKTLPVLWRRASRFRPWGVVRGPELSGRLGGPEPGRVDRASAEGGIMGAMASL